MTNTKRLYLKSWEYNCARVLQELYNIITKKGGFACSDWQTEKDIYLISNRTLSNKIAELEEKLKRVYISNSYIDELEKEYQKLKKINNEPIKINFKSYIRFILNDTMYYFQIDDNPFFEFIYTKIPVENNSYQGEYYCQNDAKEWCCDELFSLNCKDTIIKKCARNIFNMLMNSEISTRYRGKDANKSIKKYHEI